MLIFNIILLSGQTHQDWSTGGHQGYERHRGKISFIFVGGGRGVGAYKSISCGGWGMNFTSTWYLYCNIIGGRVLDLEGEGGGGAARVLDWGEGGGGGVTPNISTVY